MMGCKKYLDEKSNKSLVVIETLDDLQGLLDNSSLMNLKTPGFGQPSDDDYFVKENVYNGFSENSKKVYTWRLNNYNFPDDWGAAYNVIYNANYCLQQISKIQKNPQNEQKWNNVMGSAHFYRGYYFLHLAWDYAKAYDETSFQSDLGIVLRLAIDFNVPSVRSNVKQTYEQVINDLKESAKYLPDHPQHSMRPSKAASYGALARAYLSMRKYDSAYRYSDLSLKIKDDLLDYNSSEIDPSSNVPFKPFNKEIVFYSTETAVYSPIASFYALIDTVLYASYDSNDLRRSVFYFSNGGNKSFKGSYSSGRYTFFSGIATDELYLIRAECEARLEKVAEALDDLNTLLEKRYIMGKFIPVINLNEQQALDYILSERRKELTMRGLRWIEIKRLNKENHNIGLKRILGTTVFTLPPNDGRFALPLPQDVINITGMQQN